jgi:WNK lysine deficient protein kinase
MFCIHRPGVKDLLVHEFFAEDLGLRLEIISREEAVVSSASKVEFRLRVLDPKKRSNKHKENEAIQFEFDIQADNAEEVASEMASTRFEHSFGLLHDTVWYH